MRRWLELTPRGDSLDPLWARWYALQALWWGLRQERAWLTGAGPGSTTALLQQWSAATGKGVPSGAAFNEPAQLVYEYGLLGALAIATLCWQVIPHLAPDDPWAAAWVIGVALSLTHFPFRLPMVGIPWLAITAKLILT